MSHQLYESITNEIIQTIEAGVLPWVKPWSTSGSGFCIPKRVCGKSYQGINILILWNQAMQKSYESPYWMSLKNANQLGAKIKPNSKATKIIYFDVIQKEELNPETGKAETKEIALTKWHCVFNAHQIEGLQDGFFPTTKEQPLQLRERDERIHQFIKNLPVRIEEFGDKAFFNPNEDYIQIPVWYSFDNPAEYYPTLFHELIHWTGHEQRLNRELNTNRFGSEAYAFEELVAELGAAFLCAQMGIYSKERRDHADYIGNWLKLLKNDSKAIFKAASLAQQAVNFLVPKPCP